MPFNPRTLEALKRWGISTEPQDDPIYENEAWLISVGPQDEETPRRPEDSSTERTPPTE
jgi:hypothetical protein